MGHGLIAVLVFRTLGSLGSLPTDFHDISWPASELWFNAHAASHLRLELQTPLGPLPFVLTVSHDRRQAPDGPDGYGWSANTASPYFPATMQVGLETIPYRFHFQSGGYGGPSQAWLRDAHGSLVLAGYGSGSCTTPSILPRQFLWYGNWKTLEVNTVQIASVDERFTPVNAAGAPGDFSGHWLVAVDGSAWGVMELLDRDGGLAIAEVIGRDDTVTYCEGRIDGDLLRVSYFDGHRAVLVHARIEADGRLRGEWWDWHQGVVSFTGESVD